MTVDYVAIIKRPIITEQSMALTEKSVYTFEVDKKANKIEIKQAVEAAFNVKVVKVNTTIVKPKAKRVGKYSGFKSGYKKAVVTLEAGSKIEIFHA